MKVQQVIAKLQSGGSRPGYGVDNVNRYDHCIRPLIVIDKFVLESISSENDLPYYTEYAKGQTVTLGTGDNEEQFYVIEESDSTITTVKLLTVNPVKTTDNKQTENPDFPRFDDDSGNYETSEIAVKVGNYKNALEGRIGKSILEARLMYESEAHALDNNDYRSILIGTTKKWDYWIIASTTGNSQLAVWRK